MGHESIRACRYRAVDDIGKALGGEDDTYVGFTQDLEPFADLGRENGIVEKYPCLIENQHCRFAVKPLFQAMEQIGQDRRNHRRGVHDMFHLKALPTSRNSGNPRLRREDVRAVRQWNMCEAPGGEGCSAEAP